MAASSTISGVLTFDAGGLEVDGGTTLISGGPVSGAGTGATFNVAQGADLDLTGGHTVTYTGAYSGTGPGTVSLASGTLSVGAGGATFNFPGALLQWTGGSLGVGSAGLTNAGTINVSGGSKSIAGEVTNEGQIAVATTSALTLSGTYGEDGGSITGPAVLANCVVDELAAPATATTIVLQGSNDTLATDNLPDTTLWVQADDALGNATLTVSNGLTNDGTILLQSANVYNSYTDTLALSGTFTNGSDGTIHAGTGSRARAPLPAL